MVLAGKGAHGVGTGGGTVGGSNGRAVKLGNLEQVLASPQLALELAEFLTALSTFMPLDVLPTTGSAFLSSFFPIPYP